MTYKRSSAIVFITAVLFAVSAGAAFAQTGSTTGTLLLQGTVPGVLEISVQAEAGASALDLSSDVSELVVATVIERSNKKAGYTVTLESANASAAGAENSFFKSADPENEDTLEYSIVYADNPVTLSGGSAIVSDVNGKTSGQGTSNQVKIGYSGTSVFLYEDTYSDTLTFTITAK